MNRHSLQLIYKERSSLSHLARIDYLNYAGGYSAEASECSSLGEMASYCMMCRWTAVTAAMHGRAEGSKKLQLSNMETT